MNNFTSFYLSEVLKNHLNQVQEKNSHFSLRAFAKKLQISPATLSKLINKKIVVSEKTFDLITEKLQFSKKDTDKIRFFENMQKIIDLLVSANSSNLEKQEVQSEQRIREVFISQIHLDQNLSLFAFDFLEEFQKLFLEQIKNISEQSTHQIIIKTQLEKLKTNSENFSEL